MSFKKFGNTCMIISIKAGFSLANSNIIIPLNLFIYSKMGKLYGYMDYHSLNNNPIINKFPILRINDSLNFLRYATIVRRIGLANRYYQANVNPD